MRISDWSSDVCSSDLKAQIRHQLWCAVEAPDVADLDYEGDSRNERDAAHRLIGLDDRAHRPGCHGLGDLLCEPVQANRGVLNCLYVFGQHNVLRRVFKTLDRQPPTIHPCPGRATRINATMPPKQRLTIMSPFSTTGSASCRERVCQYG